jgi:hypothetical protein
MNKEVCLYEVGTDILKAAIIRLTNLILSLKLAPTVKTPKIISHSGGEEFLAKHERLTFDARLNVT